MGEGGFFPREGQPKVGDRGWLLDEFPAVRFTVFFRCKGVEWEFPLRPLKVSLLAGDLRMVQVTQILEKGARAGHLPFAQ